MTLEELTRNLPNGLHDASLIGLAIDLIERRLTLELAIDTSGTDTSTPVHRRARITLTGLVYCVIDPPDARNPYEAGMPVTADSGEGDPATSPIAHPPVEQGAFMAWLFVGEWNAFIRFCARNASLAWLADA